MNAKQEIPILEIDELRLTQSVKTKIIFSVYSMIFI